MEGKENNKLNLFLVVIIAFLSVAVALIVVLLLMTDGNINNLGKNNIEGQNVESKIKIDHKKAVEFITPTMYINLKNGKDNKKGVIKVVIGITLSDAKFSEDFTKREAEIKDIIRSTFNNKTVDDLQSESEDKLKEELLNKFKGMYNDIKLANKVLRVLIPESIVTEMN